MGRGGLGMSIQTPSTSPGRASASTDRSGVAASSGAASGDMRHDTEKGALETHPFDAAVARATRRRPQAIAARAGCGVRSVVRAVMIAFTSGEGSNRTGSVAGSPVSRAASSHARRADASSRS